MYILTKHVVSVYFTKLITIILLVEIERNESTLQIWN